MNCRNFNDIVRLIERRDGISNDEAFGLVQDVRDELWDINQYSTDPIVAYEECVEILQSELGLEPDYLDILLEE